MKAVYTSDGVMNRHLPWYRHVLVPFLFHDVTPLHPLSFHRNDISTCYNGVVYRLMGKVLQYLILAWIAHHCAHELNILE